jgi:hypothetical protein
MHFAGRTTAILLLASLVSQWNAAPVQAAASEPYPCAGAKAYNKRCAVAHLRKERVSRSAERLASRKPGNSGLRWRRSKLYAGTEATIPQLSPRLRARNISRLRFDGIERAACLRNVPRDNCRDERSLADALVQPPNAFTAKILRENGIPLIPDVPPIVILRSTGERWPGEISGVAP